MQKFKNKYDALNYLNDKYDVVGNEITCLEEIEDFWNDFNRIYLMSKVSENDMRIGQIAVGTYYNE